MGRESFREREWTAGQRMEDVHTVAQALPFTQPAEDGVGGQAGLAWA
jgi:hypothetical protein